MQFVVGFNSYDSIRLKLGYKRDNTAPESRLIAFTQAKKTSSRNLELQLPLFPSSMFIFPRSLAGIYECWGVASSREISREIKCLQVTSMERVEVDDKIASSCGTVIIELHFHAQLQLLYLECRLIGKTRRKQVLWNLGILSTGKQQHTTR